MELAVNNRNEMRAIAEKIRLIVEREERDMWELGALLCEARAICDDPARSAAEGLEGRTGDKRFHDWLSKWFNLTPLDSNKRKRAMRLHSVFGHRREAVSRWKTSALYELAMPVNDDVREQILLAFPSGTKVLTMRARIAEIRKPANVEAVAKKKPQPVNVQAPAMTNAERDATWSDLLNAVDLSTDLLREARANMLHPQHMVAHRLTENRERVIANMAALNKPDRKKALQAVVAVLAYEGEVFEAEARAQMPKYNRELQDRLKRELEEQKKITAQAAALLKSPSAKNEYRTILGALHPDRDVGPERRAVAFDLFRKWAPLFEGQRND